MLLFWIPLWVKLLYGHLQMLPCFQHLSSLLFLDILYSLCTIMLTKTIFNFFSEAVNIILCRSIIWDWIKKIYTRYYKLFFGSLVVIFLPKTYMFSIVFMRENRIKLIKINLKLNFIYFFNSDYQYLSLILHTKYKDNLFEKLYDSIVIFWTYFIEKNHKQVHPT